MVLGFRIWGFSGLGVLGLGFRGLGFRVGFQLSGVHCNYVCMHV